jgi:hypothetical protein
MKRSLYAILVAALVMSAVACGKGPEITSADSTSKAAADDVRPGPKITILAGTKLRVELLNSVSSNKSRSGDQFMASLAEPVVVDGITALPKGTRVRGRVIDAKESGRVKGRASIELMLTEIMPDIGKAVSISTKPYRQVAESTKKRDAAIIGGGAGVGALIGAIAGGGKGAAIGAAVGGGAGTGTVLATRGKEIHLAPETRLVFTLASPIEI